MATRAAATPATQGGEETARLYRSYGDQLYRYCLARLRSRVEAEDAVQSVWVRVHGALLNGVKPRFEAAWLYKIAHNVCLSRREVTRRLAKHEETIDPTELDWALAAHDANPDELFALPAALADMPKKLRDPFLLREWQGLTYAEIAEALDTTVSAVETLIFRARRHLAQALAPAEETRPLGSRLLDAGWLYGAVRVLLAQARGLFGFLAPAKVAAGVAVIAIGGVGVEEAVVASAADPRDRAPGIVHASTLASARAAHARVARVHVPAPPEAKPAARVFPAPKPAAPPRYRAVAVVMQRPRTAPALPPPVAEHPLPVAEPAPAAPPPVTTAPLPAPPVAVPAVTVPAVTVPAVTPPVPVVTVPAVAVPSVTVTLPTLP